MQGPEVTRSKQLLRFLVPAIVLAGLGTWLVTARNLDDQIGYDPIVIFLVLFLGALGGLAVVYYAFQLDVQAG